MAAEEGDDRPQQRVIESPRLEDDDSTVKMTEDYTVEEMLQLMERELDEEFKYYFLKEVMIDSATAK